MCIYIYIYIYMYKYIYIYQEKKQRKEKMATEGQAIAKTAQIWLYNM